MHKRGHPKVCEMGGWKRFEADDLVDALRLSAGNFPRASKYKQLWEDAGHKHFGGDINAHVGHFRRGGKKHAMTLENALKMIDEAGVKNRRSEQIVTNWVNKNLKEVE